MKLHEFAQGKVLGWVPHTDDAAAKVNRWFLEACQTCGCPKLLEYLTWEFSEEPNFRSDGGECTTWFNWRGNVSGFEIKLSSFYWRDHPDDHRKNLVIHEICHAIANYLENSDQGHNRNWGALMQRCGQPARLSCIR
jgi:hypothetical protein